MSENTINKEGKSGITVVSKMKDYSKETVFNKKAEKTTAFLKKNALPDTFSKKKK